MKKPGILILLLLLCGTAFVASPWLAARSLAQALASGNAAALDARVDFPALRADLKRQMEAAVAADMQAEPDNPFAAMAAAFVSALVAPMVDALVTPEGLARVIEYDRRQRQGQASDPFAEARMRLVAHDEFHIALPVEQQQEVRLVLLRKGLDWRLSRIEMPLRELLGERRQQLDSDSPLAAPESAAADTAGPEEIDVAAQAAEEMRAEWQRQADALVRQQDEGDDAASLSAPEADAAGY